MYFNGTKTGSNGNKANLGYSPSAPNGHLVFGRGTDNANVLRYSTFVIDDFASWDSYMSDEDLQVLIDYYMNL